MQGIEFQKIEKSTLWRQKTLQFISTSNTAPCQLNSFPQHTKCFDETIPKPLPSSIKHTSALKQKCFKADVCRLFANKDW
jgi:hypothetical protein